MDRDLDVYLTNPQAEDVLMANYFVRYSEILILAIVNQLKNYSALVLLVLVISGSLPVFGLNTGKYGPEITPYLDTFHAVTHSSRDLELVCFWVKYKTLRLLVKKTATRLEPLRGGSLLFTTRFPEIPGTNFIDLGRMKGWCKAKRFEMASFTVTERFQNIGESKAKNIIYRS